MSSKYEMGSGRKVTTTGARQEQSRHGTDPFELENEGLSRFLRHGRIGKRAEAGWIGDGGGEGGGSARMGQGKGEEGTTGESEGVGKDRALTLVGLEAGAIKWTI